MSPPNTLLFHYLNLSNSSVVVRYSSMETLLSVTVDCTPPRPIQTSLYSLVGVVVHIDGENSSFLLRKPEHLLNTIKLGHGFRWSRSILQSELLMILFDDGRLNDVIHLLCYHNGSPELSYCLK